MVGGVNKVHATGVVLTWFAVVLVWLCTVCRRVDFPIFRFSDFARDFFVIWVDLG